MNKNDPDGFAGASEPLARVCEVFNLAFADSHSTCVQGGAQEPLYRPAQHKGGMHTIIFSHDYVASALHEISHWCIAGPVRREQEDYGYWYAPDGRDSEQQALFEQMEVRPQAFEWILSTACNLPFRLSADNLNADAGPSSTFRQAVYQQVLDFCRDGLSERQARLTDAFAKAFDVKAPLSPKHYSIEALK